MSLSSGKSRWDWSTGQGRSLTPWLWVREFLERLHMVSPRSLYQELVGIPTVFQGVPNDVPVCSPKTSSSPPGPHIESGPSPGPMSPPDWLTLLQAPSPSRSDCDVNLPSTGNSHGPIIQTPTLPVKDNSFHADAISIALTSPTKAFPWAAIPPDLQHYFTIPYGKSVIDLAGIEFQPHTICACPCCQPRLVVSDNILDGEATVAIIRNLPLPGASGIERMLQQWTSGKPHNAVQVRHGDGSWTFPPWILTVWNNFVKIYNSIAIWPQVVKGLRTRGDVETLEHLRTLRWAGSCSISDASLASIGHLGTRWWLNDKAMAILVYMLNVHLSEQKSCMLSCLGSNFIWHAWQSFQSDRVWLRRNWISRLYDDFKGGSLEWLGLAVNVMVGGSSHKWGNHWISVVIDTPKFTIYIGDSQKNLPDKQVIDMLQWFLKGAFPQDFAIRTLKCSVQPRNWSCGEYSVNIVTHHFDPVQYPLLGPELADATEHWIRLFKAALKLIRELVGWPTFLLCLSTIDAFVAQDMTRVNSSLKTENVLNNDWYCYLALSDPMWPLYSIQNRQSERY